MIVLAIFIVFSILFWLIFSDSIIAMWYEYLNKRKLIAYRKEHPPSCIDCKWNEPFSLGGQDKPEFARCRNPKATYSYAETEREAKTYTTCGFSGKLFEEK